MESARETRGLRGAFRTPIPPTTAGDLVQSAFRTSPWVRDMFEAWTAKMGWSMNSGFPPAVIYLYQTEFGTEATERFLRRYGVAEPPPVYRPPRKGTSATV